MAAAVAMTPAVAAWRFGCSVLLGAGLGLLYGFLRPPGRRHRAAVDLVFSLGAVWVWLCHSFAICRGDIRTVYLFGMVAGILLWESTVGLWLRPVFSGFWRLFGAVFRTILLPWKKNFGNCKNFVCIWGKMGYNKVYENFQITKEAEKGTPWQKKAPRPKK